MTGRPPTLDRDQIAALFPFHILIDGEMRILDVGDVLRRVCPSAAPGTLITDHFAVSTLATNAGTRFDRDYIVQKQAMLFILKVVESDLTLRFQVVLLRDPERFLFLGSPWVRSPSELRDLNLVLRDFALHDSTGDLLQLVQTTRASLNDAEVLASKLEVKRNDLKQLIDTANAPIIAVDAGGHVVEWNHTTERLTGIVHAEAVDKPFIECFVEPDSSRQVAVLLKQALADKPTPNLEFRMKQKDAGELLVIFSASPRHNSDGTVVGVTLVGQDISELGRYRAQLEHRVAERTAELQLANAELSRVMRSKDDFLSAMSHELRTPLNAILGLSELMAEGVYGAQTPKQIESLRMISESGQHLLALINDLLDIAKIGAGKMELSWELCDVGDLCAAAMRLVAQLAQRKHLNLRSKIDPDAQSVWCDGRRLKQILVNLLANAVKFTHEGGTVTLEVMVDRFNETLSISVRDTGIGIARDDLTLLFKPFTQLDSKLSRQYSGTGLGLTLVMRLTELHGGRVSVESELGKGSVFGVTIPWAEHGPANKRALSPSGEERFGSSLRSGSPNGHLIVNADDNEICLVTVGDYLRAQGFEVIDARNGLEAISAVRENRPDLVLMDIQMPVLDGLEAIRQIRSNAEFAALPIVALTSRAMVGDREMCMTAGAVDYISKPANLKTLVATIRRHIANRSTQQ